MYTFTPVTDDKPNDDNSIVNNNVSDDVFAEENSLNSQNSNAEATGNVSLQSQDPNGIKNDAEATAPTFEQTVAFGTHLW